MMPQNSSKQQSGLTLIELMIALVLGLLLVAGVIQIFVSNKHSYRVTEAHSRLQDNARFALEVLSKNVRSAGYSGCRAIENMNVVTIANAPVPASMTANTIISGSEATSATTWSPAVSVSLGAVVGGTDVITLIGSRGCGATLTGNVGSPNANIQVFSPNTCNLVAGDALMIADCEDSHIFRATNVSNGAGQQTVSHGSASNGATHFCKSYNPSPYTGACAAGDDNKLYGYDSELLKFVAETYFIRAGTNGDPALWKLNLTAAVGANNPVELVEGIENMQIEYGVDTNDDDIVDDYRDAQVVSAANAGVGEWDKVISARISLLAQTLDQNLTTAAQNITYNGNAVTGEGRIRRVFTTTIGVRNRVQ